MKNMKNFWKVAVLLCLCLTICLSLAACGGDGEPTEGTQPTTKGKGTYTVEVFTTGGLQLKGVEVYVYTDSTCEELETISSLDANGRMSFEATLSSNYVAVLMGVPDGYNVQEYYEVSIYTKIELTASVITDEEKPADKIYNVGDVMYDFSITAADGTEYTLSKLLEEKEAVVLNFWYLNCSPCKLEFPYLELAYERYSDSIEVLGINCEDGNDSSLLAFQQEYGLTFPVAIGDKSYWYPCAYGACPTTIVVDRYGVIIYKHTGYFDEVAPFAALFRTVTGEDYKQVLVNDVADIITDNDYLPDGTLEHPFEMGGAKGFDLKIPANGKIYYNLYRLDGTALRIEDPNIYVIVDGETYYPTNGVLEVSITCPDSFTPAFVTFGNSGSKPLNVYAGFVFEPGNINNPLTLNLGDNVINIKNPGAMGLYHNFVAPTTGTLTITIQDITAGATPDISIFNGMTQQQVNDVVRDPETGLYSISIHVNSGDQLQIIIGAYGALGSTMSSVTITAVASIQEGDGSGIIDGKTPYSVLVVDQDGRPVANVSLQVKVGNSTSTIRTNENGVATLRLASNAYLFELVTPLGYVAKDTSYLWSPALTNMTITLTQKINYSVTLKDQSGNPMKGVLACVYGDAAKQELLYAMTTDTNGAIRFSGTIYTNFYVEFVNAPAGSNLKGLYVVNQAETVIVDADPNATYGLGDSVREFAIRTADGSCTTLKSLLMGKDALVLTFYNGNLSESLRANLQYAYETYGKDAAIVALAQNVTAEEQQTLGFLLAKADEDLVRALQVKQYPTTIVIDREGKICLVHAGALADTNTVDAVFTFFTNDAYLHTIFTDLSALLNPEGENMNGSEA